MAMFVIFSVIPADAAEIGTIRFAVPSPLTGDMAEQGYMVVNGCTLAIEEINAAGGIDGRKFEAVPFDDQGTPNQSTIVAEKIVADNSIEFVISHLYSGCTMAAMPVYLKKGISVIAPGNSRTDLTHQGWKTYLRTCPADVHAVRAIADYIAPEGYKRPYTWYQNGANEVSAIEILTAYLKEKYGIEVVGSSTFDPNTEKDFSSHIVRMKDREADIVLASVEYPPAGLLAKQMKSLNVDIPLIGTGGMANAAIISLAGDASEGLMCTSAFDSTNPDPRVQKFLKDFTARFGNPPNDTAAYCYDTMYAIADALKNGATTVNLAEWMRQNTDYHGMNSDIKFDENGDNEKARTYIIKVEGGKFKLIH
jgi:branched-chain amino acid transport system substrate-binding protein